MTLVDTSAWVEFLRRTGSDANLQVRSLISSGRPVHTTEPVVLEVLAGARGETEAASLRRTLLSCELVPVDGLGDHERAAALYREGRRAGVTVRSLVDCLIATVAIRSGLDVLHSDRDFEAIADFTDLELHQPPRSI